MTLYELLLCEDGLVAEHVVRVQCVAGAALGFRLAAAECRFHLFPHLWQQPVSALATELILEPAETGGC